MRIKTGSQTIERVFEIYDNLSDEDRENVLAGINRAEKQMISKYMSSIAKAGHKKHPRSREFYSKMGKLGGRPKGYKVSPSIVHGNPSPTMELG